MPARKLFSSVTSSHKSKAIEMLISHSSPCPDYFMMIILSILMATFGLLVNNIPIVIGSMLITPVLYPVLSLSMGIAISDTKLITRSFYTILTSTVYAIIASAVVTLLFKTQFQEVSIDVINSQARPSLIYAAVAIVAGLAASFALAKPDLNERLPGVAIAVALFPPLAATGIGIGIWNWDLISGAFLLFLINVLGVVFASMVVFSIMNFYVKKKEIDKAVDKEEKDLGKGKKEMKKE